MYEDIKKFLNGKDPEFQEELEKIHDLQSAPNLQQDSQSEDPSKNLQIIAKYKRTDAYKRLLRRQGQAVRRIERIKENFEKKRMQVTMLAVNQKMQFKQHSHSPDNKQKGDALSSKDMIINEIQEYQDYNDGAADQKVPTIHLMNSQSNTLYLRPQTQGSYGSFGMNSSLRPILSSQTPLSHQVIMEERSSIASQHNKDKMDLRMAYQKHKEYEKVEPYMKTSLSYFKKLNQKNSKAEEISTANKRQKSMINKGGAKVEDNLSVNLSHLNYESQGNFSGENTNPNYSPNNRSTSHKPDLSFITGIETYQNEIIRNKAIMKKQRAFYQPATQTHFSNVPFSYNNRGTAAFLKDFDSSFTITNKNSRPQTTAGTGNVQHAGRGDLSFTQENENFKLLIKSADRSQSQQPNNQEQVTIPVRNLLLPKMPTQQIANNAKLQVPRLTTASGDLNKRRTQGNIIVREQDEEYQDSKKVTINKDDQDDTVHIDDSGHKNRIKKSNQTSTTKHIKANSLEKKYFSTGRLNDSYNEYYNQIINSQKAMQQESNKEFKNPVQKYQHTKNQIIQNIKSKQYWPESIKHPDQFREFYWAPDYSFCGFATNQTIAKSIKQRAQARSSGIRRLPPSQSSVKQTKLGSKTQSELNDLQEHGIIDVKTNNLTAAENANIQQ